MKVNRLIRIGNAAAAIGVVLTTLSAALLVATSPADAAPVKAAVTPVDSSVTVDWAATHPDTANPNYAALKNLKLSVSQTANLVNQGITVSWSGAKTTSPTEFATNYLQFMQCWGDEADGPTPQQCQWGAASSGVSSLMGTNAAGRGLRKGEDPGQSYDASLLLPPPLTNPNLKAYAYPFTPVKGDAVFDVGTYFTSATTNEVSAARTGQDGTGSTAFETQTSLEAPHLGCGASETTNGVTAPRACWLVAVPRGDTNADGSAATDVASGRISGSPFSATNWANRIVVKLGFQSVSQSCPIGNAEQRVVGSELIQDAITSWQPLLCATGTTYGYSQIGDAEAGRQIVSGTQGASGLAFVSDPIDASTVGETKIDYAPIAQSALVVAFNIDYSIKSTSSNFPKNGTQVESLKLNARLIAKLLTQSYRDDIPGQAITNAVLKNNPSRITQDPEFLDLNPNFDGFTQGSGPDGLMVALGNTDAAARVWQWLRSDPFASSFLAGEPDDNGMVINPAYKSLNLATDTSTDSYPKADLTTYQASDDVPAPGYGTLDLRPYMNDMHDAAYRSLRADSGSKIFWDATKLPPAFTSSGAQLPGSRFELAITDVASAARYGLNTAKLVNAAGQALAATDTSISKAISVQKDSTTTVGVKVADPSLRTIGAYPLSMVTYAAVNVCGVPKKTLTDYAKLLKYGIGAGQVSGQNLGELPEGYVPLTADLTKQTTATIADLTKEASGAGTCSTKTAPSTPTPSSSSSAEPTDTTAPPIDEPSTEPSAAPSVTPTPTSDPEDVVVHRTKDAPINGGRLGLLGALALGILTIIAGPILSRLGRKLADRV